MARPQLSFAVDCTATLGSAVSRVTSPGSRRSKMCFRFPYRRRIEEVRSEMDEACCT